VSASRKATSSGAPERSGLSPLALPPFSGGMQGARLSEGRCAQWRGRPGRQQSPFAEGTKPLSKPLGAWPLRATA